MDPAPELANDPVLASLEALAETGKDITSDVYERFFTLRPDAEQSMEHTDTYMRGRMMEEVLQLLMTTPDQVSEKYLQFETENHTQSYGVDLALYQPLLEAVRDTVQSGLSPDWTDKCDRAWSERITALVSAITRAASA